MVGCNERDEEGKQCSAFRRRSDDGGGLTNFGWNGMMQYDTHAA
jgi:hypothetical protein